MNPDYNTNIGPDLESADLIIFMGSTFVVHPVASVVETLDKSKNAVLINNESLKEGKQYIFDAMDADGLGCRAFFNGDCSEGCKALAEAFGLEKALKEVKESYSRTDPEAAGKV